MELPVVRKLPAARLLAVPTLASWSKTVPSVMATPLITLPGAKKLPAPSTLPTAMVVTAPI